jgi:triosephosphate isomerase
MRRNLVVGNWKMNKTRSESAELLMKLGEHKDYGSEVAVAPPYPFIDGAALLLKDSPVKVAAQDVARWNNGAYTGEVSAEMLKSIGVEFCLVGHSERRQYFQESELELAEKIERCLENNIEVIYCFGEVLSERKAGIYIDIIEQQLEGVLAQFSREDLSRIILAYEPVWAIGTGETATPDQAQEVHALVRSWLDRRFDEEVSSNCTILYGGSCKPTNASDLFEQQDIDGGLIGGASLVAEDFIAITRSFS